MRKYSIVVLLLVLGGIFFIRQSSFSAQTMVQSPVPTITPSISTTVAPQRLPKTLIIPKLDVHAHIEYVGMDDHGNMAVPKKDADVGWYQLGYQPGEAGNSVIAGHLDTVTGAPAVFYKLNSLEKGDRLSIVFQDGSVSSFHVIKKAVYPVDRFPLVDVFGPSKTPRLNLITCEGRYSSTNKSYSHRTVVYSELVK